MSPGPKFPQLSVFDLKSKDAKYKRWSPKMDHYLVKLLADAIGRVKDKNDKKVWAHVTNGLRAVNPQTVYSTYTKYSCQQHLFHVIHHRYKIWYALMVHQDKANAFSYTWNSELGKMELINETTQTKINDENALKDILYRQALPLPSLSQFSKGLVIVNEMFLTDNLRYMSLYHSVVVPYLIEVDSRYADIEDYNGILLKNFQGVHFESPGLEDEIGFMDTISDKSGGNLTLESTMVSAAIAAVNSPSVIIANEDYPVYVKDRKWFSRLIALHEKKYITSDEVLAVSIGVRDGKVPLFMLNILDASYGEASQSKDEPDDIVASRVRTYMLPLVYQ